MKLCAGPDSAIKKVNAGVLAEGELTVTVGVRVKNNVIFTIICNLYLIKVVPITLNKDRIV